MAEHWAGSPADPEAFDRLHTTLYDLGYRGESGYLVQSVAKFWFSNHLGRLTVYPAQAACIEAGAVLRATRSRSSWARSSDDLAFVLPISTSGSRTQRQQKKYGGKKPRRIFKGGGPFIIKDSEGMVAEALRRMGYMDGSFNSDLPEALFVFVNRPEHKSTLRKTFEALPVPTDTAVDVEQKLRHAFLSNLTDGQWIVAPKDTEVRKILCRQGLLESMQATEAKVLRAMQRFVRSRGLREMRSYNGLTFTIQQHIDEADPSRVGTVQFRI